MAHGPPSKGDLATVLRGCSQSTASPPVTPKSAGSENAGSPRAVADVLDPMEGARPRSPLAPPTQRARARTATQGEPRRRNSCELPKPAPFDEERQKAARRQRAETMSSIPEAPQAYSDAGDAAAGRALRRIQRANTSTLATEAAEEPVSPPISEPKGRAPRRVQRADTSTLATEAAEEPVSPISEAKAGSEECPGGEWAARLLCLEAREARRESCRQVTALISAVVPQMEDLPRKELQKVTNILDVEIEAKQRQLAQEAYVRVCKDFEELKVVKHQMGELESKMAQMNITYLKEITAHRDRQRSSADLVHEMGSAVQFYEPTQHLTDEMRALFLCMLEEKLKAIFDYDPALREKVNKAELARFDSSVLQARVDSYEKINRQLREEVRDLTAKLKKSDAACNRSFWEHQKAQEDLSKVKESLQVKEAEIESTKDEFSKVKFLQDQARERQKEHEQQLLRKQELVDVMKFQARDLRRRATNAEMEGELSRMQGLIVNRGVQTDAEPPRPGSSCNVDSTELTTAALDEEGHPSQEAIDVVEHKEDLELLVDQEVERRSSKSPEASSVAGFKLAGTDGPIQEPEPEHHADVDGDPDGGDGEGSTSSSKNAPAARTAALLASMCEGAEECASRVGKLEGADLVAVLLELQAARNEAQEARDAAALARQSVVQVPVKPRSPSSSSSSRGSPRTSSNRSSCSDDDSEDGKVAQDGNAERLAEELQAAQEALLQAELQLETLPALREELETEREHRQDAERRLALICASGDNASALKKELMEQSVARTDAESEASSAKAALSLAVSRNKSLEASLAMFMEATTGPSGEQDNPAAGEDESADGPGKDGQRQKEQIAKLAAQSRLREKLVVKRAQLQEIMRENTALHLSLEEMQREVNDLSRKLRKALPQSQVITKDLETVMAKMERVAANGGGAYLRMHKQALLKQVAVATKVNLTLENLGGEQTAPRSKKLVTVEAQEPVQHVDGDLAMNNSMSWKPVTVEKEPSAASKGNAQGNGPQAPFLVVHSHSAQPQQHPTMSTVTIDPFGSPAGEAGTGSTPLTAMKTKMRRGAEKSAAVPHTAREGRRPAGRHSSDLPSARAFVDPGSPREHKERMNSGEIPHISAKAVPTSTLASRLGNSRPQPLPISPLSHTSGSVADPASPVPEVRPSTTTTTLPTLCFQPLSPPVATTASLPGNNIRGNSRSKTMGALLSEEPSEFTSMAVRMRPALGRGLIGTRRTVLLKPTNDCDEP